jgi:aminoglycoside phosphotransferase family enzyme
VKQFQPEMLLDAQNYDSSVQSIQIKSMPTSWIFLTGEIAYKIKKPVKIGDILDFTTLELRKQFCEAEITLNKRFSPDMYINSFSVNAQGKMNGKGTPIEYGVKMKEYPQKYLLSNLLDRNKATKEIINRIAEIIADYHSKAIKTPQYGEIKYIGEKWDENFRTTSNFRKINEDFRERVSCFIKGNRGLFQERINEGRITETHGDFQPRNIFVLPDSEIKIFDCIEFNPLLQCGDVAEDVAFLMMELEYRRKNRLAEIFFEAYTQKSGDDLLEENVLFFKCYRAYVRGKINGFQASFEPDLQNKEKLIEKSNNYYQLAYTYSKEW